MPVVSQLICQAAFNDLQASIKPGEFNPWVSSSRLISSIGTGFCPRKAMCVILKRKIKYRDRVSSNREIYYWFRGRPTNTVAGKLIIIELYV